MRNVVTCDPAPARLHEEPRSATGKPDELTGAAGAAGGVPLVAVRMAGAPGDVAPGDVALTVQTPEDAL